MIVPNRRACATQKCAHPTCRRWGKWLSIRILHTPYASFNVLLSNSKKCGQVTSIQIQVCMKSLALYEENYGRGLKILFFVALTKLVTARLHKRSSSTFGNLDRMLDWICNGNSLLGIALGSEGRSLWKLQLWKLGQREKERERF